MDPAPTTTTAAPAPTTATTPAPADTGTTTTTDTSATQANPQPAVDQATTTAAATTTLAAPSQYFGFNDNAVAQNGITPLADAAVAGQIGANVSRVTFDWRYAEKTQGTWDFGRYDAIYARDLAQGIQPVFILAFAPQWAWADPNYCATVTQACRYAPGPTHLDAWRTVVTKLVARYPQMAALEIWNEPNLDSFWKGGIDPAYYTQLLGEAHNAVSAAGSSVPVLGGALSGYTGTDVPTAMSTRSFVKAMYAAGAKGKMEGLSLHPYATDVDLWRTFKILTEARDLRDAAGDNVPLWIDEIGMSTTGTGFNTVSENDQAVILAKYYSEFSGVKDIRALLFHTLIDVSQYADTDSERGYGALRADLSPKPAFCAIAAARKTSYACPSAVAPVSDMATQQLRWNAQDMVQRGVEAARTWYASHKTYVGLTTAQLHAIDPALSATGADAALAPGPTADPSRVSVYVWGTAGSEILMLCNTSRADRSYCVLTQAGTPWTYGSSVGNVNAAAGATSQGLSTTW